LEIVFFPYYQGYHRSRKKNFFEVREMLGNFIEKGHFEKKSGEIEIKT